MSIGVLGGGGESGLILPLLEPSDDEASRFVTGRPERFGSRVSSHVGIGVAKTVAVEIRLGRIGRRYEALEDRWNEEVED